MTELKKLENKHVRTGMENINSRNKNMNQTSNYKYITVSRTIKQVQ